MSLLAVGLSHRSAPVSLLERVAVAGDATNKLLHDLQQSGHVEESLVLSTCNRVEVYADVERFHGGVTEITELLARSSGVGLDELTNHLYVHYEDRAVQHLFEVAVDVLKRAKNLDDPKSIRDAIVTTDYSSIVGPVKWSGAPVKNVTKTPLVAGQWQRTGEKFDLVITENAGVPQIPVGGKLQLLG